MRTGRRAWKCELSTIDSAFFYWLCVDGREFILTRIQPTSMKSAPLPTRSIAARIGSGRKTGAAMLTHGWKPESGFLKYRWEGYDEAMLLYILGLGSPDHPLPESATQRGLRRTGGNTVTDMNTFTPDRCSRTNSRISGSIFAKFRMSLLRVRGSTISRIAAARRMSNNSTRWTTRSSSRVMARVCWGITASDDPVRYDQSGRR